ncbi:MAG: hypothetical protein ABWY36_05880 [Leifsonia sp.]
MAAVSYSPASTASAFVATEAMETPDAAARVAELQARIRGMQATRLETAALPTSEAMAAVLPGGALRQGGAYSVAGSLTLAMALLAGPSASGAWCGVVGVPDFGAEAAARFGIDLERLVLVPDPGEHWLTATAALVDVLTVVVLRPPARAGDADVARLSARLRQRGAALVVLGAWPQSDATLSIAGSTWSGLGAGHGHLAAREVTVTATGRLGYDRPRSVRLWLPDGRQAFRIAEDAVAAPHLRAVGA